MKTADDRGSAPSRLRALMPVLVFVALLLVLLCFLLHASQSRRVTIRFAVLVEGAHPPFYTAHVNGEPYKAGERSGIGSKSISISVPDAEPFRTNVFAWYSGVDLGTVNLSRSKGTLRVEIAPAENRVSIRGEHFQKVLTNCGNQEFNVPVGDYDVAAEFERVRIVRRATVLRDSRESVQIKPELTVGLLSTDPPDADFHLECQSGFPITVSGKAPASLPGLPVGKYHLTASRGSFVKTTTVELIAQPTNRLHVVFDYARISFKSDPEGAEVRHGTEILAKTPATISLIPGHYRVSMAREGFLPSEAEFDVAGHEKREVSLTLVNVAFVESMSRVKSVLNDSNPDYDEALDEIAKALKIYPSHREALQIRDDTSFLQTISRARNFMSLKDYSNALKFASVAVEARPRDERAISLKAEVQRRISEAKTAELLAQRQRQKDEFSTTLRLIKDHELFETQLVSLNYPSSKVLNAIRRTLASGSLPSGLRGTKSEWKIKRDSASGDGRVTIDAEAYGFFLKQQLVLTVQAKGDEDCDLLFKLWQYEPSRDKRAADVRNASGFGWEPLHPNFRSSSPSEVETQRRRGIEALLKALEAGLKAP